MTEYKVEFYKKENGKKPVEEFLESQDKKMRAKISGLIELLEESGPLLREPYSKHLDDGIMVLIRKQIKRLEKKSS